MSIFRNHSAFILTSVNAEQLKQVGYEKDSIIDVVAARTGSSKSCT
jgi:hypothetical protein